LLLANNTTVDIFDRRQAGRLQIWQYNFTLQMRIARRRLVPGFGLVRRSVVRWLMK